MKILFLAHRVPVPPNKGEKIRAFHQLCFLARHHQVDLLALTDDHRDLSHLHLLDGVCRRIKVVERPRASHLLAPLSALLCGKAVTLTGFASRDLARTARQWQQEEMYDAVFAFSSTMAQYVDRSTAPLRVLDMVDVDSVKWEQYAVESKWPMRWLYRREGVLVAEWERTVVERFDVTTFVSRPEAELFRQRVTEPGAVLAIDNGVADRFCEQGWAVAGRDRRPFPTAAFMGTMDYRPNVDGVSWFTTQVWPLVEQVIPEINFKIIGARPAPSVCRLARRRGIHVTGFVPDVLDELRTADIFVAPLRIARGVQNKVLEALAFGLPVVATPQALEGIDALPGEHLLVATDAEEFAAAMIELLQQPEAALALGQAARRHMITRYRWEHVLEPLSELFSTRAKVDAI